MQNEPTTRETLILAISRLPESQLAAVEQFIQSLGQPAAPADMGPALLTTDTKPSCELLSLWVRKKFAASTCYNRHYLPAVTHLERYLGRAATLGDLNAHSVIEATEGSQQARQALKSIWNAAMREGLVSVNYQPDARLIDYACLPINAGKSRVLRDALALLRDSVGHEPLAADLTQENIDRAFPLGCCKKNDIRLNRLHAVIELAGWLGVQIDKPKVTARARTEHEMIEQVDGQLALAGLFRQYYRPKRLLGKSQNTTRLYEITIRKFCRWLGRPAMLSDLTDETVGSYVQWLLDESGNAGHTIEKEATQLLVLWRYASRRQMGPAWPEIRPPEPPEVSPDAFTREELSALIEACRTQQGLICGMPAGIWWEALVSVIFDSGERVGAVLSVQWSDLSGEWLTVPAKYRKGKRKPGRYRLRAGTLALLQEMRAHSEEPVIFAWHMSRGYVWQRFSKIVKQAGIEDKRRNKFHKIRRTVATFFEQAGGDATRLLQHNSRKTTEAYLDESMIQRTQAVDLIEAIT